ncbi:MAG TPA: hypothetical protein PK711_06860 [Bacteroidales bacterium]|nr:hypothetical protein [Bacteroidales bacterium]HRZ20440.1 hypothetical protein [Bacteroidales bacterium]
MMKAFTFEDLFSHTFDELKADGLIDHEMDGNAPQPKAGVIRMIMDYSRALSVHKSGTIGNISLLLN